MKAVWILAPLLLMPAAAIAAPEADVAAVVKATIDHLADGPTTFAKGATVIGIRANVFDYDTGKRLSGANDGSELDVKAHGRLWPMIMDKEDPASTTRTLGRVAVVVDAASRTAWFQAPLEVAASKGPKRTFHVSGVATADAGGAWSLRVFQAGATLTDRELANYVVLAPWDRMTWATTTGGQDAAVIDWFKRHAFAKNAAAGGVLAGGSAPAELATGPAAQKLAAVFDRITNLRAIELRVSDSGLVATGIALWLHKTERDGELELGFAIYAVKDGGAWKWRSIQFFPSQYPRIGE